MGFLRLALLGNYNVHIYGALQVNLTAPAVGSQDPHLLQQELHQDTQHHRSLLAVQK